MRMVLAEAVADNKTSANPADHVKIPGEHSANGGKPAAVDDPAQFLSAAQVSAVVTATPWPYNVLIHVAARAGLRAAELGGLHVGDVVVPPKPLIPNAPAKLGTMRVAKTVRAICAEMRYFPTKTLSRKSRGARLSLHLHRRWANLFSGDPGLAALPAEMSVPVGFSVPNDPHPGHRIFDHRCESFGLLVGCWLWGDMN